MTAPISRFCQNLSLLLLVGIAGCDQPPTPPEEVRPVKVERLHYQHQSDLPRLVGDIRPHYEADLSFKISGRILARKVQLGDQVHRGQVVAILDDRDERNQLRATEADLTSAKATLAQAAAEEKRQIALNRDGWATQAKLEAARQGRQTAEAAVASAAAKVTLTRDQHGYTTLLAPEDGAITQLSADAGQMVAAGQAVVRMARLDDRDAVFSVSESAISHMNTNMPVDVSLLDRAELRSQGIIREISPIADAMTRTYTVKVSLPSAPPAMRLGMTVDAHFPDGDTRVADLPTAALFEKAGKPAVWIVDPTSQTVSLAPVTVHALRPDRVQITAPTGNAPADDSLSEGVIIVTAGVQFLRPGQKVRLPEVSP